MRFPSFMKGSSEKKVKRQAREESMKGWELGATEHGTHQTTTRKKLSLGVGNHPIRSIKSHV
jgi:hypothetical protein